MNTVSDQLPVLDPAVTALCAPIAAADPCGPDLDLDGDADYLNFFAQVDGILPTSFFSIEGGKPFDPSTIDITGQLAVMEPLLARTRDIRLLVVRARLLILNKDLAAFAATIAAIAECLDRFWDAVHPRPQSGELDARQNAISGLDLPTVVFPLQYAPLFEARRAGSISYRRWMIATGEVKPRAGDAEVAAGVISEAVAEADPSVLASGRKHIALLKTSFDRIRKAFAAHGSSAGLEAAPALIDRITVLIDPHAVAAPTDLLAAEADDGHGLLHETKDKSPVKAGGPPPTSIADATRALAAIAEFYSHSEPSSPCLPLLRQAHSLIGKSFLEIMTVLMPSHVEKAAFQIGTDPVFELPVAKLPNSSAVSDVSESASAAPDATKGAGGTDEPAHPGGRAPACYRVESRPQALALLDLVQRYFRLFEPSSPVPMLCERARALAERDFMGVLRDVLPKSVFRNIAGDK